MGGYGWWRTKPPEEQIELLEYFLKKKDADLEKVRGRLDAVCAAVLPHDFAKDPDENWSAWADHPAIHVLIEGLLDISSTFMNDIHKAGFLADSEEALHSELRFWRAAAANYARIADGAWTTACERYCDRRDVDPEHHHGDGGCVFLPVGQEPA